MNAYPVEVTDEVFARMQEHFTDKQIVEITALLTLVNLDRFNAAFGIGSAGFSDGLGVRRAGPPERSSDTRQRGQAEGTAVVS